MDECDWKNTIPFYPGEDAEALKSAFVELYAVHRGVYSVEVVARQIFKDLKEPTRYLQASVIWGNDIDVMERIRVRMLKGPPVADCSEADLIKRALQIADGSGQDKDRIAAIRLAGELQGFVKKSVDLKTNLPGNDNSATFLAALSAKLPN